MSLAALRAEIAACRAWERALGDGSPSMSRDAALPGRGTALLPLLMPIYGLIAYVTGSHLDSGEFWILILPWWWSLTNGRMFPRSMPTEWEALRLPSRRAWLLARWSLRWPWLVHMGLCTVAYLVLRDLREIQGPPSVRWPFLAAWMAAPFLVAALAAWQAFQERAWGGLSLSVPMIALILVVGLFVAAGVVGAAESSRQEGPPIVAWFIAGVGAVIFLLALPSWNSVRKAADRRFHGRGLAVVISHAAVGLSGLAPLAALAFTGLAHRTVLGRPSDPHLEGPAWLLLGLSLLGTVLVPWHALRLLDFTDIGAEPRAEPPKTTGSKIRPVPIPISRGAPPRGLRAAAWTLYRAGWRNLSYPWLLFVPKLLWECRAPALGAAVFAVFAFGPSVGSFFGMVVMWPGVLLLALTPFPLHLKASHRLHLLGADFSAVALHNLRWGLLLTVIPAALGGGAAALVLGSSGSFTFLSLAGAWGTTVAVLLLRAGVGIDVIDPIPAKILLGGFAATGIGWFVDAPATLGIVGTVLLALALHATVRDFRDPASAGARLAGNAAED